LAEIKQAGGITMAQSPEDAEFASMPESAIAYDGIVDLIAPTADLARAIERYVYGLQGLQTEPCLRLGSIFQLCSAPVGGASGSLRGSTPALLPRAVQSTAQLPIVGATSGDMLPSSRSWRRRRVSRKAVISHA
jgi:CheB methylesterase